MIKSEKHYGSFTLEVAFLLPLALMVLVFCIVLTTSIMDSYRLHEETNEIGKHIANHITWFSLTENSLDEDLNGIGEKYNGGFRKSALEDYIQIRLVRSLPSYKNLSSTISWEDNVLFISQNASISSNYLSLIPNLNYDKTYVFACPGVQEYFTIEISDTRVVMITQHGKSKTHVYHTHECWALKNAKTTETIKWPEEFDWNEKWMKWEGIKYTLCKLCAQDWKENQID